MDQELLQTHKNYHRKHSQERAFERANLIFSKRLQKKVLDKIKNGKKGVKEVATKKPNENIKIYDVWLRERTIRVMYNQLTDSICTVLPRR
jgi:membrane carboxypeptidase/penicillin-binding protein